MYPILRPFLNKGGAGRSLSRADTIEALNPLVVHHGALIDSYNEALRLLSDRQVAQDIERVMNRLRTELVKLKETVLALGGVPPNGVGRAAVEPLGSNDSDVLRALGEREAAYRDALRDALGYPHHQIRTIAILENNVTGSSERLRMIRPLAERAPRRTAARPTPVDRTTATPADLEHTAQSPAHGEQPAALRAEKSDSDDDK
jgi:hypothetical protein